MSDERGSNLSSLKRRLAALFAVTAAAVIAGGMAYDHHYRASLVADTEKLLTSIEDFKIQQIVYWRNDRLNDTGSLLDSPILSTHLNSYAADPSNAGNRALLTKRLEAYLRNNSYTAALLTRLDGEVLVAAGRNTKRAYPEARAILAKANASGRPVMGDFNVLPGEKKPHIDLVALAAKGPSGKNLFLLLRIDPQNYIYPLIEKWPTNSRTGETQLAGREGDKIVFLNPLRESGGAAMTLTVPVTAPGRAVAMAFTGKPGVIRGRDYRGASVLAAVDTIPGTNWAIVTKMDMDEVLAGSGRVSVLVLLLALSLLGGAGAGAYLVFRRQAEDYRRSYAELDRQAAALKDNYALLTAQANDAIIIADAESLRIVESNRKSHEMYGYTEEEFSRLKFSDLVPESDRAALRERVETVRNRGGAVIETDHKRKNGELFPAEISSACTANSGKEFIFAIIRDISERKRLEQTLRDREENYRQLFEAESDAIFLIDNTTGAIQQANAAATALYGYTQEELLALRNSDLSAEPEDTNKVTRTTPMDPDKVVVIPLRYHRKKSGEVFPVEITGRFFTHNGRPVHIVAIRDITQRKKADENLRLGEERLRMAAEAAQFGVYSYDFENGARVYSQEFLGLFGLPPGSNLPLDADQAPAALYPEDREGFLAARGAGSDPTGPGLVDHEFRIILPTGLVRWLRVRGRTVFTGTGAGSRPLRANGIIQDVTDKKQTELTLRESEERYRSLFENMLNGMALCRMLYEGDKPADFLYIAVNKAFETQTGLKGAVGKKVSELIPGIRESDPGLLEIYGRVARGGKPETFETYVNALKMWFSISVYSPAKEHFVTVFDVITERKEAEQALLESRNRLSFALEGANDGIWDVKMQTGEVYISPRGCELLGYGPGELQEVIKKWDQLVHPDDLPATNARLQEHFEGRAPVFEVEQRLQTKSGGWKWILTRGKVITRDEQGRPLRVTGTHTDITKRRQAEEALRENERRLAALFSNLPGIAYRCRNDRDWTMEFISEGCKKLTGYEASELTGGNALSFNQLIVPADRDRVWEGIQRALAGNRNFQLTYGIRRKDGELRTVWEQGIGVKNPDGEVAALEGFISDVTAQRKAELALEKLNRDLVEKKQEMENFLYITTHDLRGPLVNIQGFSQNLEGYLQELKEAMVPAALRPEGKAALEKLTGERIPTALKFVVDSSRKMDALITALLKVSRLGRVEMKPENIEMNGLVDNVIESLRYQLEKAGGGIKCGDLPRCKADPGAVSQLFTNLLDNAVKYRQEGRTLSVTITGEVKDGAARYCVRDNGSGIPKKNQDRIWDIFYRHDSAPGKQGEGIGLPMVKRIAEKNGGNISVESKPGEGTVFYVQLPAARDN